MGRDWLVGFRRGVQEFVNIVDVAGWSAIHDAVYVGKMEMIDMLADAGGDFTKATTEPAEEIPSGTVQAVQFHPA